MEKIIQTDENIVINTDFQIEKISLVAKAKEDNEEPDTNIGDNLKNLTFNLNLKEEEFEAKRNLILPYEIINKPNRIETVKINEKKPVEAMIFYQPDKNDDIDEEDPDEDLNF